MNVALIILIIVILVFALYIIYYVGFSSASLIDLSKATVTIPNKDITNPTSTSFTYGLWLYVNNWTGGSKEIVKAETTKKINGIVTPITRIKIYLAENMPTLKVDIGNPNAETTPSTIVVTNNFPIQRWVYIVVSVEGSVVDCYLDGKLVKSQNLRHLPNTGGQYSISYGLFDAYMTLFSRIADPTDPQTVWNTYMAGNGFSPSIGPAIGFKFQLTKDKKEIAKYVYE